MRTLKTLPDHKPTTRKLLSGLMFTCLVGITLVGISPEVAERFDLWCNDMQQQLNTAYLVTVVLFVIGSIWFVKKVKR